jgi:Transposase DDE domain
VGHEQGEVLGLSWSPGNTDDRRPVARLVRPLRGKRFGDRGYSRQNLCEQGWSEGLPLITKRKRNMKNKLMPLWDKLLLRQRALMEGVNDQWKNISQIEHTRHRRATNGIVNMLAAVVADTFQAKKPALDLFTTSRHSDEQQILIAATI